MGQITICDGQKSISCTVRRAKRKRTMALRVEPDGQVTVMIPRFLNINVAQRFVESKISWVRKQQNLRYQMALRYPKKEFTNGETFSLFGRTYRLKILCADCPPVCFIEHNRLIVRTRSVSRKRVRQILEEFLKIHTVRQAEEGVQKFAPQLGVTVRKVFAANQTKRWGSCSKKGTVRINWKLAMAPLSVFDYVVAHEVCHLKYSNHSEHFWRTLKSIVPNYEKNRIWLKENLGLIASFE